MERQINYRSLFTYQVEGELLEEIRTNTNKEMAIGHDRFKEKIEKLTGRRVMPKKRGRPLGWRKNTQHNLTGNIMTPIIRLFVCYLPFARTT